MGPAPLVYLLRPHVGALETVGLRSLATEASATGCYADRGMGCWGPVGGSGAQRLDPGRPKMTPRQLKTAKMSSKRRPRRPRMAQEASKTAQEASEKAQEAHKTLSDGSQEAKIVGKHMIFL